MAVISSPTFDPKTTATNLANNYVAPTKAILDAQGAKAKATSGALTTLGSALSAFQGALAGLTTGTKTVSANSATISNTAIATASANSKAVAGTYSFYVEQLATAGQVSYNVADSTATNVQTFLTAYNTLLGVMNTLTAADPDAGTAAALHGDAGLATLRDRLGSALRAVTGGQSLINFGITAGRDGMLTLDTARLNKTVAANPAALDSLFGQAGIGGAAGTGALGAMNKLVAGWTNSASGYIGARQQVATKQQSDVTDRLATLENQFNNAYQRYLAQFTALQTLQGSMTSTSNMFTAMFSSDSNN